MLQWAKELKTIRVEINLNIHLFSGCALLCTEPRSGLFAFIPKQQAVAATCGGTGLLEQSHEDGYTHGQRLLELVGCALSYPRPSPSEGS